MDLVCGGTRQLIGKYRMKEIKSETLHAACEKTRLDAYKHKSLNAKVRTQSTTHPAQRVLTEEEAAAHTNGDSLAARKTLGTPAPGLSTTPIMVNGCNTQRSDLLVPFVDLILHSVKLQPLLLRMSGRTISPNGRSAGKRRSTQTLRLPRPSTWSAR